MRPQYTRIPPAAITPTRLSQLEAVIERGQQTFIEVGAALLEIRDSRLYLQWYQTFEDYCQKRWGWSRIRAHQMIDGARVAGLLTTVNAPSNEAQARELVPLMRSEPDAVSIVWESLRETHGDTITAADVREAVQERIAAPPKMAVHYSSDSPEWHTPKHIVDRVAAALDGIRLDPCSNSSEHPNVPATFHFTAADDGLSQEWHGTVYMNPPYGREIADWIEKLATEYESGRCTAAVALVPARTDTAWFRRLPAEFICFIAGRLTFSEHESAAPFPSAAVYLGSDPERFRQAFADVGCLYRRMGDAFLVEAA